MQGPLAPLEKASGKGYDRGSRASGSLCPLTARLVPVPLIHPALLHFGLNSAPRFYTLGF